ncbi:hypothetical protein PENTCL1PPCAC_9046 [Pristionchus entomophagus]|uniref:Uncharacterized protein n=1 Tax=Pristionchus entomophagus TaxID=358040 RepID=A0AAV5T5B2_9BILA|nr:hypothetical protein PENTCL1PPCAC_9046 [Pristionchus entomophagus]
MLVFSFVFALFSVLVESRVTFQTSEVLDDVDLQGTKAEATFRCFAGCRVYSPTVNANIVVVDRSGKQLTTLMDLANLETGEYIELPESNASYKLKNKGADNPSFVFYAVEKGAMNYETKVLYVNPNSPKTRVSSKKDSILTVMSTTGAVRFEEFAGDYSGGLPSVYATGFDSVSGANACRPVYNAVSETTLANTAFPVYSPIATVKFSGAGTGKSVIISGDIYTKTKTGQEVSSVYVSPGYVGCNGDSLYTSLPIIASFDSSFTVKDSDGLLVGINGDYSIANKDDALTLTVNDDTQALFGSNTPISETYDATLFKIAVKWAKKNAWDRFALQIDVKSKVPKPSTTRKVPEVDSTTSGAQALTLLVSFLLPLGYLSTR